MSRQKQLEDALIKAHSAGDAQGAAILAGEIRKMRAQTEVPGIKPNKNIKIENPLNPVVEMGKGMKGGFDRAAYGMAGLVDGITPDLPISQETRDAYNQNPVVRTLGITMPSRNERQAAIDQSRATADASTAGMIGDAIGNSIPNVLAGVASGGATTLPAMITQGAASYMATPGGVGDRMEGAAYAAGGEGLGRALPMALGRVARPIQPTEAAQRLMAQGVYPTPGQAAGGGLKKFEDAMTSAPGIGSAITRGQNDALEQGVRAAMSQGGLNVPAGREGYKQLSNYFDNAFQNSTNRLAFDLNEPAFDAGIQQIVQSRGLDRAGTEEVQRFFNNLRTNTNTPQPGTLALPAPGEAPTRQLMGGSDFHAMLQNLRNEGTAFRGSQDPFQKRVGEAYKDIYNLADNSLATQGIVRPEAIQDFRNVRRQYAMAAPALKAGELNTVVRNQGIFTPEQYQSSVANNAKKMGQTRALREGTLPQQQMADDMVEVLGGKYPDSGTAYRLGTLGVPAAAAGIDPVTGALAVGGLAAGYGLGRLMYSEPGRRYMLGGFNGQSQIADALRRAAPETGFFGAVGGAQLAE